MDPYISTRVYQKGHIMSKNKQITTKQPVVNKNKTITQNPKKVKFEKIKTPTVINTEKAYAMVRSHPKKKDSGAFKLNVYSSFRALVNAKDMHTVVQRV